MVVMNVLFLDKFVSMMDMSRTATSIELEEPAEDDTLYSKYRERLHVMVRRNF